MKGIQKTIAAERIRRQLEREREREDRASAYAEGLRRGRSNPDPVRLPVDLIPMVVRDMAGYMAREAFAQNQHRNAVVAHNLAEIVESAVKAYPFDYDRARQFAEYRIREDGALQFDFGIDGLRAAHRIPWQEIALVGGHRAQTERHTRETRPDNGDL